MIRRTAIAGLALIAIVGINYAAWSGIVGDIFLETGYDSNPGILTSEQMEEFEEGDPYYLNMESYDDVYTRIGGEFDYRFRIQRARAELSLYYRYTDYLNNPDNSYHYAYPMFEIRRRGWHGEAWGEFVFGYATSIYNDTDYENTEPEWAIYDAYRGGAAIERDIIGEHSLAVDFEYGHSRYDDSFPEYDGAEYRIGAAWRWSGPLYIKLAYAYRIYDARAYDTEGENAASSDDTDISYNEDRIESYISRDVKFAGQDFFLGGIIDLSQRFYTSEKDFHDDYIHVGRRERRADIAPFVRWEMSSKLSFTIDYEFTIRDADSPYYDISALKDYTRSTVALRAEYSFH